MTPGDIVRSLAIGANKSDYDIIGGLVFVGKVSLTRNLVGSV